MQVLYSYVYNGYIIFYSHYYEIFLVIREAIDNSIEVGIPSQYQYLRPSEYGKTPLNHATDHAY